ncbi:AbrB family transcriptional regulator, partial [Enterobacter roggenkampii]
MELGYAMHLNTSAVRNIKPDIFHIPLCRERNNMRIVSIFKNGNNRAIR